MVIIKLSHDGKELSIPILNPTIVWYKREMKEIEERDMLIIYKSTIIPIIHLI